jgi:DNA-binding transcriptional ArsR family regulator
VIPTQGDPAGDAIFDALGDPTRRAILRLLAERPRHVAELAELLPVSRPAVSQGLRVLRECQFVMAHPQGTRRLYRIDPVGIAAACSYLEQFNKGVKGTEQ